MLSRPATKITLTLEDLQGYEQRRLEKDAAKVESQSFNSSQSTENSLGNGDAKMSGNDMGRQAREKRMREMRIMGGGSRG